MPTRDGLDCDHEELLLLWGARRAGVIEALTTDAGTPAAVARETGLDEETSARFVDALAAYGYLREVSGEYEVTNRALGFLATRDVRSIGATPRALDVLDALASVGEDRDEPTDAVRDERLRHRLGSHAATPRERVRAVVTTAVAAAPDAERVVDVYGASGVNAAEFARRGYDVTLVDEGSVVDIVGPMVRGRGVETREVESTAALPVSDVDLAVLVDVLHHRSPAENRALLTAVDEALVPGGTVVVVEPLRGTSPVARRIAVERLALGHGDVYTGDTVEGWLEAAGFVDCVTERVPDTETHAIVARRERGVK